MQLYFEIAGNQIDGARDYQEDAFLTTYLDDVDGGSNSSALVVMADGMGGHAAGNIASNLVVSTFNKMFTGEFGKQDVSSILRVSLEKANSALRESIDETPALDGMGCTMVTAALTQGKVWWVSVGDSHLYLIRDRELIKKNEDHSYGGYLDRMKEQGMYIEPEPGLSRNMLMSAMTGDDVVEIDCPDQPLVLRAGDRLIIASDGLDTLTEGDILQFSAWVSSAKECLEALLKAVEDAAKPRQDNTTVIVVDVLERGVPELSRRPQRASQPQPLAEVEKPQAAIQSQSPTPRSPPRAVSESVVTDTIVEESPSKGKGRGLLVAVVVFVALVLGAGAAWMMMSGKQGGQSTTIDASNDGEPVTEPDSTPESESAPELESQEFQDPMSGGGVGPIMVRIPGGKFDMGAAGFTANQNEFPQHEVVVRPFSTSKYEVSYAEYGEFTDATERAPAKNPSDVDPQMHPVRFVSWEDALAYTTWLSGQTGKKYRLLSEAEWEYIARANTFTEFWWGDETGSENAHCADCKSGLDTRLPTRAGRFQPNAFGVHDTAGNVQEWVHDCYKGNYIGAPSDGNVWEHGECTHRVTRGGSYDSPASSLRSSSRNKRRPTTGYDAVGIRLARDLEL